MLRFDRGLAPPVHRPDVESSATAAAKAASLRRWQSDLAVLLATAEQRFADVAWRSADGRTTWAHKAIVYARSTGSFQLRFLQANHHHLVGDPALATTSPYGPPPRLLSSAPHTGLDPMPPYSSDPYSTSPYLASSAAPHRSPSTFTGETVIALSDTDHALLSPALEVFYTAQGADLSLFEFLYGKAQVTVGQNAIGKLREDLNFMWRSRLYADVQIRIVGANERPKTPIDMVAIDNEEAAQGALFTAHRAILSSRSPYFANILLSGYADSSTRLLTLPASAFTPASLHFLLGGMYCGTLEFGSRHLDFAIVCDVLRGADYLQLETILWEAEMRIADLCHGWRACCKDCVHRCVHVFRLSRRTDLDVAIRDRLHRASRSVITRRWSDAWTMHEVADLEPAMRDHLAEEAAGQITAHNAVQCLSDALSLRNRLARINGAWTRAIVAMLGHIERRIRSLVVSNLAAVVRSTGFAQLLDGLFFTLNREALSCLMECLVEDLTEEKAPTVYQTLTATVLMREAGMLSDARRIVEEARDDVMKYIKKRWPSMSSTDAFQSLEKWAQQQIADELGVTVAGLLYRDEPPCSELTKTGLRVTPKRPLSDNRRPSLSDCRVARASRSHNVPALPQAVSKKPTSSSDLPIRTAKSPARARKGAVPPVPPVPLVPSQKSTLQRSRTPTPIPRQDEGRDLDAGAWVEGAADPSPSKRMSLDSLTAVRTQASHPRDTPIASRGSSSQSHVTPSSSRPRGPPKPRSVEKNPKPSMTKRSHDSLRSVARGASTASSKSAPRVPSTPHRVKTDPKTDFKTPARPAASASSIVMPTKSEVPLVPTRRQSVGAATTTPARRTIKETTVTPGKGQRSAGIKAGKTLPSATSSHSLTEKSRRTQSSPSLSKQARAQSLVGTTLRVPLPALVSFSNGIKAKAAVHFIGETHLGPGSFVGVCIDEASLTDAAKARAGVRWGNGSIGSNAHFAAATGRCAFVRPHQVVFLF